MRVNRAPYLTWIAHLDATGDYRSMILWMSSIELHALRRKGTLQQESGRTIRN